MSRKNEQLKWRRSKVIEMRSRGLNQVEIAHELQVSKASISSDMQYLRKQAKESINDLAAQITKVASITKGTYDNPVIYWQNRKYYDSVNTFDRNSFLYRPKLSVGANVS